jgi:hypothetical protein
LFTAALSLSTLVALAEPVNAAVSSQKAGPLEGTFRGRAQGDRTSSAPITLTITQRGNNVNGTMALGTGLRLDAGGCGAVVLPALTQSATGRSHPARPRSFTFSSRRNIADSPVSVGVNGRLSADGRILTFQATIDLPDVCGRDPIITGTLWSVK